MRKIGGIALLLALCLSGCSPAPASPVAEPSATQEAKAAKIAPLVAVPEPSQPNLAPEFKDESLRAKYLDGVKHALNAWRDGVIPSDDVLIEGAVNACKLFAEGKTYSEIGAMAGNDDIKQTNGAAVAVYASRTFCAEYNTDNL